jgi:FkbM family methyltransferase
MFLYLKQTIILIFSFLPDFILLKFEQLFSIARGKGFNFSLKSEFKNVLKLNDKINVFVDIGANKGGYTDEILKIFPNAKGYLFEPNLNLFKFLQKKYKKKNITVFNNAFSNRIGFENLYMEKSQGRSTIIKRRLGHYNIQFKKKNRIRVDKMSEFFKKNIDVNVDFCKIDIEGSEFKCLLGFENILKKFKCIQFEFNGCSIDSKTFFQDFWYFFKKQNFEIYRITPSGPLWIKNYTEEDENFSMNNYIAVNKK